MVTPKRLYERGITLIEAMIVAAIVGGVMLVVTPIMTNSVRYFVLTRAKLELQREARSSMAIMTRYIREGQASTIVIDRATGQPFYSRITFTRNTASGTQQVSFYQSGKNLIHTVGTRTSTLSRNVRYLAFTFPRSDDMGIMSVAITVEQTTYQLQTKALHMASERVRVMNQ